MSIRPLRRSIFPRWTPAPARILHVGLGAFHRAHQADFTDRASDAPHWGITAFTGASTFLPQCLEAQDGLYTLTVRGGEGVSCRVVTSLVQAHAGGDRDAWHAAWASPDVQVVTLTVTEDAYAPGPHSVATRLLDGLAARRRADGGPLSIVSCDNVPDNAAVLQALVLEAAAQRDDSLSDWIATSVGFVGSVVDRITPAATHADKLTAADFGWSDAAPVVTEPFAEWVIGEGFVTEHPDWASAGAQFVDDLTPFARRKLHLLNGAHSLIAHAGLLRGHQTVAQAVAVPAIVEWVEVWWVESMSCVGQDSAQVAKYLDALIERFANARIVHNLEQIAIDSSRKLPVRVAPVARHELAAGRGAHGCALQLGAWVAWVRAAGERLVDAQASELLGVAAGPDHDAVRRLVSMIDPVLADDDGFCLAVTHWAGEFHGRIGS